MEAALLPVQKTSGDAISNMVIINTPNNKHVESNIWGGIGEGSASMNRVYYNSGRQFPNPTGELTIGGGMGGSIANFNLVKISAGNPLHGAQPGKIYGGYTKNSDSILIGNRVVFSGGYIGWPNSTGHPQQNFYGAYAEKSGFLYGNNVTVSGGDLSHDNANIYAAAGGAGSIITGNSVTLSNGVTIGGTVYGGYSEGNASISNNALNIIGTGVKVKTARKFDHYNFALNPALLGQTALTVNSAVDMSGSRVQVGDLLSGDAGWHKGDSIVLIDKVTNHTASSQIISQGLSLQYQSVIDTVGNALVFQVVGDRELNPQTKAASEAQVAGMAMLNQGGDVAVSAVQALSGSLPTGDVQSFISTGGSSSRYKSGSHVDVSGTSVIAGFAKNMGFGLLGGFFESGRSSYKSFNGFSDRPNVKGSGDTRYTGVGLLGRYDLNSTLRLDGTLRTGRSRISFSSDDWCDVSGRCADYNSSVTYYGASLALNHLAHIDNKTSYELNSGLQWLHQRGTSLQIVDDPYSFASTDSERWRNGIRLNHSVYGSMVVYGGVAYEYEFSGKVDATSYGMAIDAPTVKGGTVISELGIRSAHKIKDDTLSFDASVQSYNGKRDGHAGQLRVNYAF